MRMKFRIITDSWPQICQSCILNRNPRRNLEVKAEKDLMYTLEEEKVWKSISSSNENKKLCKIPKSLLVYPTVEQQR